MALTVGSVVIHLGVDTTGMARFNSAANMAVRDSARMRASAVAANSAIANSFTRTAAAVSVMHGPLGGVASRIAAIGTLARSSSAGMAGLAVGMATATFGMAKFVQAADRMRLMENQLKTVTTGTSNLRDVQQELLAVSQRSRSAMDASVTIYARTARATEHLGLKQKELLRITETVQKAFAIGGASTQEAQGAAIQLSQGIASDRFSGDEFRSVAENAPVLLREMGRAIGVNIGKLREMAHAGQLTADVVTKAILEASGEIDRYFAMTEATVGQSWTKIRNAMDMYVHEVDTAYGVTRALAGMLNSIADNFETVGDTALFAAGAMATFMGGRLGAAALRGGGGYVSDVMTHGLFARTRMQAAKELDDVKKTLAEINKHRRDIERQIKETSDASNKRLVDMRMAQHNALAAARNKEAEAQQRINGLTNERIGITNRLSSAQAAVVDGLRKERAEAQRLMYAQGDRVAMAGQRFATTGRAGDLRAWEREQKKLTTAQEQFRVSTERLAAAQNGTFDARAMRLYGAEIKAINAELKANHQAQIKAGTDLEKARVAYLAAQRQGPAFEKAARAEMEKSAATMAVLRGQEAKLNEERRTALTTARALRAETQLIGAAAARAGRFIGGMWSLLGGGPGVAIMAAIGSFIYLQSEASKAAQRSEKLNDEMRELGLLAQDASNAIDGTAKSLEEMRLDEIRVKLSEIGSEIERMKSEQGFFDKVFNYNASNLGNIQRVIELMRTGGSLHGGLPDELDKIVSALLTGRGNAEDLLAELNKIGDRDLDIPTLKLIQSIRFAIQRYEALGLLQERVLKQEALLAGTGRSGREGARSAEDWSMRSINAERVLPVYAAKAFEEEQIALASLTEEAKRHEKVKDDLRKAYEKFVEASGGAFKNVEILESVYDELARKVINAEDATKLLNEAQQESSKVIRDAMAELSVQLINGDISIKAFNAAVESMSDLRPDLSNVISQLAATAMAAMEAKNSIDALTGKGGRVGRRTMDEMQEEFDFQLQFQRRIGELAETLGNTTLPKVAKGSRAAANAYRDLMKSARDRIEQMELEVQVAGKTGVEADVLRFRLELLQKAQNKGRTITADQVKEIEALTEAFREVATLKAFTEAMAELRFERDQLFRTESEQRVFADLRSAGLDINTVRGQTLATEIRINEALKEQKEQFDEIAKIAGDAFADLFSKPNADLKEFIGNIASQFASIGRQNLSKVFDNLFSSSSISPKGSADGDAWAGLRNIGESVERGAATGSEKGTKTGVDGIASLFKGAGGGLLGAGLGGFGMGYQSQSPIMGGLGGIMSGWGAGASITALGAAGGPIGAAIGGIAGIIGGIFGNDQKKKEEEAQRQAEAQQRTEYMRDLHMRRIRAHTDTSTLKGSLREFDESAHFERLRAHEAEQSAEMIAALEMTLAAERKRIIRDHAKEERRRHADLRVSLLRMTTDTNTLGGALKVLNAERRLEINRARASGESVRNLRLMEKMLAEERKALTEQFRRQDIESVRTELDRALESLRSFAEGIGEFRKSLLLDGSTSTLSMSDRLKLAQEEYEKTLEAAMSGDEDAMKRLQSVTQTYLDLLGDYFASGPEYAEIFDKIMEDLKNIEDFAWDQVADAEKQIDLLAKQVDWLKEIDKSVLTVAELIKKLQASVKKYKGFSSGGFTGIGSSGEIAGFVHRNEGVLAAPAMKGVGIAALNFMNTHHSLPVAAIANDNNSGFREAGAIFARGFNALVAENRELRKDISRLEAAMSRLATETRISGESKVRRSA